MWRTLGIAALSYEGALSRGGVSDALVSVGLSCHAGAERAAVQGLRLLGCYLKACSERAAPPLAAAQAQIELGMQQALESPVAIVPFQEWDFTCGALLPQVKSVLSLLLLSGTRCSSLLLTPCDGPARSTVDFIRLYCVQP